MAASVWWLLLSVVAGGSMAFYVSEIWSVNQLPRFNDFYAPWWGSRELLHGRNPYSPEVAHEIQREIYAAPANAPLDDPANIAGGFAYPPFAAILLWPTLFLSFPVALKVFQSVSALLMVLSVVLWARILRVELSLLQWMTVAIFALGSFPALQGLQLCNLSALAAGLLAIAFFLLSADKLVWAGILLGLATFKPQFVVGIIPWLGIWVAADWRRRHLAAWSFLATMIALVLVSDWLVPGWISSFIMVARAYRHYTYGHSLLDLWFTPAWGPAVAGCLLLGVLLLSTRYRARATGDWQFLPVTSLVLATTLVVIPTLEPHAQLLLLPGILCLYAGRRQIWSSGGIRRLVLVALGVLLVWPWIASVGLLVAAMRYPLREILRFWQVPLYTSPLLPLAVSMGLGCLLSLGGSRQQTGSLAN